MDLKRIVHRGPKRPAPDTPLPEAPPEKIQKLHLPNQEETSNNPTKIIQIFVKVAGKNTFQIDLDPVISTCLDARRSITALFPEFQPNQLVLSISRKLLPNSLSFF